MTTGGFHLLSGLFFASFIRNEKYRKVKWGIVFGSIIPDIDLIFSMILYLTGADISQSAYIHRTFTHGFLTIGLVVVLGFIISRLWKDHEWIFMVSLGIAFGMLTHVLYDLLDGEVAIFAPFTFNRFSLTSEFYREGATSLYESIFDTSLMSVWTAFDCMSDVIAYLLLWYWATYKGTVEKEKKFAKVLLIVSIISIPYYLILMILAFTPLDPDIHFIICYAYWCIIHCPLSCVLIFIFMRETIQDFSFLDIRKS
ncbi:MAG: metal-dependent hydrolase [Promethearchaeota archaeon]|nr:MAG: metal-dependent hydrolase [Candidatus Lokiarchaeota archaeon]